MTVHSGTDLCRVRVIAPRSQVDLALPTTVALADLLPAVLRMAGEDLGENGVGHGGWALQRLGEEPLDTAADIAELGLRDGEVLHLRPRRSVLPAVDYDDVVDAVGSALRGRPDRWRPAAARAVALVITEGLLVCGAVLLARSGPDWTRPWLAAAVASVALLAVAGALARALGDGIAGTVVACGAMPYVFLTGLLTFAGDRPLTGLGAPELFLGAALVVLASAGSMVWVGDGSPALLALLVLGLAGVLGIGLDPLAGRQGAAASVIIAVAVLGPLAPSLSFRLARLPLPFVPAKPEELRRDLDALPTATLLRRAVQADRLLSGLTAGTALATLIAIAVESRTPGWSPPWLGLVAALALLLRARLFTGLHQRLWLLLPALAGLALVALRFGEGAGGIAIVAGLLAGAAISLGVAMRPLHRPYRPYWPRVGDLAELLVVAAVIPIALEVLGVYGFARSLWG